MIVALIAAAIGGAVVLQFRADRARRAGLRTFATQHGWAYSEDRYAPEGIGMPDLPPFGQGFGQAVHETIIGTHEGQSFRAFAYQYKTRSTDGQGRTTTTTHQYSVVALDLGASFPALRVTPENMLTRLVGKALGHDLLLEDEDFNRAFTVRTSDAKFATDVLHPRQMEFLKTYGREVEWFISGSVAVSALDATFRPAFILPTLGYLAAVVSHIPDFVWADHPPRP